MLLEHVNAYMAQCGEGEEVGLAVASFGREYILHIQEITAVPPNLLILGGRLEGRDAPASLCIHQSQLNVLLVKVKALDPAAPVRKVMGFIRD